MDVPSLADLAGLLARFPMLLVVVLGQAFGGAFTQTVKKTYLAFQPQAVNRHRYRISVWWLAVISTYLFTVILWHQVVGHSGAEEIISIGFGLLSPPMYNLTRRIVQWKFPLLASKWGGNWEPDSDEHERGG
jgi:hypothetical protein